MKSHTIHISKAQREQILLDCGIHERFDTGKMDSGVACVSNKTLLSADGKPLDEYLGGAVSNASNPTALTTALPNYGVGLPQRANLRDVMERVAPLVPGGETFQYVKYTAAAEFAPVPNGEHKRAVGARKYHEVKRSKTLETASVDDKGLSMFVDRRLGGLNPLIQRKTVEQLMNMLLLTDLLEVFTVLDANDTAISSVNWGTANTSANPDKDLVGLVSASGDKLGNNPNVILFGGAASLYRKQSLLDRQNNGATFALLSDPDLATFLEVDEVVRCSARYQSAAATKSKIGGANVYAFAREAAVTLQDPSTLKRVYDPTAGADFSVHIQTLDTGSIVTVWHANKILLANNVGIYSQPVTYTA